MTARTIETKAIISAQDKTGAIFAEVAQKLRAVENAAASASKRAAGVSAHVSGSLAQSNKAFAAAAAAGSVIGGLAVRAANEAGHAVHAALTTYESVDDSRRAAKALLEQTESESLKMLQHAMDLGTSTRFGPKEIEESYKELAGRIHSGEVIEGITDVAAQLAMALGSDLPEAVKVLENTLFATGVNVENATEGLKVARQYSAQLMKTAKLGGFSSLADVAEATKFPTGIASVANVSLPTEGAFLAAMKRGGQGGPEAGVALRQFVAALAKPTEPALMALDAAGLHYKNYVTAGKHMSAADLSEAFQRRLGKKLSPLGVQDIQGMLDNPELAGDQAKFTAAAMKRLGENLKPQDARQISKVLEQFWKASIEKVDINRLLRDLIGAHLSVTQLDEIFGSKQGSRFAIAARAGLEFFDKTKKQMENVPLDYPDQIAKERMAGVSGAMGRLEAATEKLGVAFMAANETWLIPALNEVTKLANSFSELDASTLRLVTAAGSAVTGLAALTGSLKALSFLGILPKGATGRVAAAIGGAAGSILLNPLAIGGAALLGSTTAANAGENEFARQQKYNLFRLGAQSFGPPTGKFSPWPGSTHFTELKGAAVITNRIEVDLSPDLVARTVRQVISAEGNLRADTGVTMPPSMMPNR